MRDKEGSKYITISRNFKKENIVCMQRIKSDSMDEIILLSFITFFPVYTEYYYFEWVFASR